MSTAQNKTMTYKEAAESGSVSADRWGGWGATNLVDQQHARVAAFSGTKTECKHRHSDQQ